MSDVLRVKTTFAYRTKLFYAGTIVDAGDPVVKGREALFEAVAPKGARQAPAPVPLKPAAKKVAAAKKAD